MNVFKSTRLATQGVMLALAACTAHAADGTITFQGTITDVTCAASVSGQGQNATLTLPTVSTTTLASSGATAGTTPFTIALSGCTGATANQARTRFEIGANVNVTTGRLTNGGTAGNVNLQLLASDNTVITLGASTPYDVPVSITSGSGSLQYAVRYYATGAATAGTVSSSVEYTIVYQ
jgi:major type 1 subunit fimbrin (pilin)